MCEIPALSQSDYSSNYDYSKQISQHMPQLSSDQLEYSSSEDILTSDLQGFLDHSPDYSSNYNYSKQISQHMLQLSSDQLEYSSSKDILTSDLQGFLDHSVQWQDSFMFDVQTIDTIRNDMFYISTSEANKDGDYLEIVFDLEFHSWEQLDRHVQIYAKQNGFVSIIIGSESDDIT
ncbi:16383_t:CDS:1, partial [Gigaspora margarita]